MAVTQTITITEGNLNPTANTSAVTVNWSYTTNGGSYNLDGATCLLYIYVNGSPVNGYNPLRTKHELKLNKTENIGTYTITANHKSDGSGEVKVTAQIVTGTSSGTISNTNTKALTKIARISNFSSIGNTTPGQNLCMKWIPSNSSYKYRIRIAATDSGIWSKSSVYDTWYGNGEIYNTSGDPYSEFNTNYNICPGITSEYTCDDYTVPIDFAKLFPNSNVCELVAYLATYDENDNYLGVSTGTKFYVYIPDKPTISSATITSDNSLLIERYAAGDTTKQNTWTSSGISNLFISGFTKEHITATATGVYSSKITKFEVTRPEEDSGENAVAYILPDEPQTSCSLNWKSGISISGGQSNDQKLVRRVQAFDSRTNGSEVKELSVPIYSYSPPVVTIQGLERSQTDTKKITISVSLSYSSLNKINVPGKGSVGGVKIEYKKIADTTWNTITLPFIDIYNGSTPTGVEESTLKKDDTGKGTDSFSCKYTPQVNFDDSATYDFRISVEDFITETASAASRIGTKKVLLDFKDGATGLAVGKMSEMDAFEVALPLGIQGGIMPIALENETNLFEITTPGYYTGGSLADMKDIRTYTSNGSTIEEEITKSPVQMGFKNNCFLIEVLPLLRSGTTVTHVLQRLTVFIASRKIRFFRSVYGGAYVGISSEWCDDGDCSRIDPRAVTAASGYITTEDGINYFKPNNKKITDTNVQIISFDTEQGYILSDKNSGTDANPMYKIETERFINGSSFSCGSNSIKCKYPGFVQVSAQIRAVGTGVANGSCMLAAVYINGENRISAWSSGSVQSGFLSIQIPAFVTKVNANDSIAVGFQSVVSLSAAKYITTLGGDCTLTVKYL